MDIITINSKNKLHYTNYTHKIYNYPPPPPPNMRLTQHIVIVDLALHTEIVLQKSLL